MGIYTALVGFLALLGGGAYLLASTLGREPGEGATRCPTCDQWLPGTGKDA